MTIGLAGYWGFFVFPNPLLNYHFFFHSLVIACMNLRSSFANSTSLSPLPIEGFAKVLDVPQGRGGSPIRANLPLRQIQSKSTSSAAAVRKGVVSTCTVVRSSDCSFSILAAGFGSLVITLQLYLFGGFG